MQYQLKIELALADKTIFYQATEEFLQGVSFYIKSFVQKLEKTFDHITFTILQSPVETAYSEIEVIQSIEGDDRNLVFQIKLKTKNYKRMICYFNTLIHEFSHALVYLKDGGNCNIHIYICLRIGSITFIPIHYYVGSPLRQIVHFNSSVIEFIISAKLTTRANNCTPGCITNWVSPWSMAYLLPEFDTHYYYNQQCSRCCTHGDDKLLYVDFWVWTLVGLR